MTEGGDLELQPPLGGTIIVNHTNLLVTLTTLRQELDLVKLEHRATRQELDHVTAQLNITTQALAVSTGMDVADEISLNTKNGRSQVRLFLLLITWFVLI